MNRHEILTLIYSSFDEVNTQLPKSKKLRQNEDEVLFGIGGKLDSLGLTNLIVSVEQGIEESFSRSVNFFDPSRVERLESIFKNAGSLADEILRALQ